MYIRTKSNIYETESPFLDNNGKWVGYNIVEDDMAIILRSQVIREADTIEELCDEFVLYYGDTMQTSIPIPWATYERRDDNWQKHKEKLISELKKAEKKATVYGAIWTSKGLIYVAKMNSDGKLVLI